MIVDQRFELLRRHRRDDLLGDLVHVAVAALQLERRLGAKRIRLRGRADVLLIDLEERGLDDEQVADHREDLAELDGRVAVAEIRRGDRFSLCHADDLVDIAEVARREWCDRGIRGQGILEERERERVALTGEHVAEVVDVGAVREHVGDPEGLPTLGVRVARHHDAELLAAQVVGAGLAMPDAFDLALCIAQRDELLEQLGRGVLDVVEVEHHVRAHLECEGDLLDLLACGGIRRLGGIERGDRAAERGAIDLDEREAEARRDVLHEGGLAVAGRRHEQQHPHLIGALVGAGCAELLREVRADERQVDLVDQAIAHERRHHARRELADPQPLLLARTDLGAQRAMRTERRCIDQAEPIEPRGKLVQAERESSVDDARVATEKPDDLRLDQRARGRAR